MIRVNYDELAPLYDERLRDHRVDEHLVALLASRGIAPRQARVLDVGCGTGKQLAANCERLPGLRMVGLDRFAGMLRIARQRCPGATWVHGDGATLPFGAAVFDYVTSQFSYQHVRNTPALVAETYRVLRPGGRFAMTNIDPWSMPGWLVYQYFPEAVALDHQDFVRVDEFTTIMRGAGFERVETTFRNVSKDERLADFFAYASERHRASQMMAISDAAYAAGLRRLEDDVRRTDGEGMARSDFVFVTITGEKSAQS
jgi:ubiquinone/menaquinone biosynthesis C-methylase UbiE